MDHSSPVMLSSPSGSKLLVLNSTANFRQEPGSKLLVLNSTVNFHQEPGSHSALQTLFRHCSGSAFQNSDDEHKEAKCRPGTRVSVLDGFEEWVVGKNDPDDTVICWVHGPAGTGKTAIARSLTERCSNSRRLAASFFFWRTNEERTDEKRVISTLVYQLALSIPPLRPYIEKEIHENPALLCQSPKGQVQSLLLTPLECLKHGDPDFDVNLYPSLIVVDGLDECGGMSTDRVEAQRRVMDALRMIAGQPHFPFRIFITSRTEPHIFRFFSVSNMRGVSHQPVDLSKPYYGMRDDIRTFVDDDFNWIKRYHRHKRSLPHNWPGPEIIDRIVERSSGQFIYAATVMKYIRSQSHLPAARLKAIMGEHRSKPTDNPFTGLDTLYQCVITSAAEPETALLLIAFEQVHPPDGRCISVEVVEDGLGLDRGAVRQSLADFQSLLATLETPTQIIKFHHASFPDFLFDKLRAGDWHIDIGVEAENFAILDLDAFETSDSRNDAGLWLQNFCSALRKATPSERLKEKLRSTWLDLPAYSPGQLFLQESGLAANIPFFHVHSAIASSMFPVVERRALLKDFIDTTISMLQEYIQPYRSHPLLYALVLLHASYGPYNLHTWQFSDWDTHLIVNVFDREIISCHNLFQIDQDSLVLVNPERDSKDSSPHTSWLHALLRHLSYFSMYMPPNDGLLIAATEILLQAIINAQVHDRLDRHRIANFVGWLVRNQSPSRTAISQLEHPNMALQLKLEIWNHKDVQAYICRATNKGIPPRRTIDASVATAWFQPTFEGHAIWVPTLENDDVQVMCDDITPRLGQKRRREDDSHRETMSSQKKARLGESSAPGVRNLDEATLDQDMSGEGQKMVPARGFMFDSLDFDKFYLDWADRIVKSS